MATASATHLDTAGVYRLLAHAVASRASETGARMEVGATPRCIAGLAVWEGVRWAGSGVLVGPAGTFAPAALIVALRFVVDGRDPITLTTVGGVVLLVALAASAVPALRGVPVDPSIAMRNE